MYRNCLAIGTRYRPFHHRQSLIILLHILDFSSYVGQLLHFHKIALIQVRIASMSTKSATHVTSNNTINMCYFILSYRKSLYEQSSYS